MDAASTDGSVDILRRLAGEDPRLKFISEPDKGEADATNKGMSLVTGEIMGVQASDDFYVADAVGKRWNSCWRIRIVWASGVMPCM